MKTLFFLLFMTSVATAQQASHGLFAMPTAHTLPKGTHVVSSYELIFLQYSYSPTNSTHISAFAVFPFTADAFTSTFAFGVKQRLYKTDMLAVAVTGSYLPDSKNFSVMGLASIGTDETAVHLGAGRGGMLEGDGSDTFLLLGGNLKVGSRTSVIAEFITSTDVIDTDFKGLFSIGGRFRTSEGLTIDFGVMRPVTTIDLGGFLAFPILKATYEF